MRSDLGRSRKSRPWGAAPLLLLGATLILVPRAGSAANVLPGHDLFEVRAGSFQQFSGAYAIPAGFFGPGSLPFEGRVDWVGVPIASLPSCADLLSNVHAAMRRPMLALLSGPGADAFVPVEMAALAVVGRRAITVEYAQGPSQQWEVRMSVTLPASPLLGSLRVGCRTEDGGSLGMQLPVLPRFQFRNLTTPGQPPIVWNLGAEGFVELYETIDTPWNYASPGSLLEVGCDSNFKPGVNEQGVVLPMSLYAPWSALVLQWPAGGAIADAQVTWGAMKASYRD